MVLEKEDEGGEREGKMEGAQLCVFVCVCSLPAASGLEIEGNLKSRNIKSGLIKPAACSDALVHYC